MENNKTEQIHTADFIFTVIYPEGSYRIPMQGFKPTNSKTDSMTETLFFNAGFIFFAMDNCKSESQEVDIKDKDHLASFFDQGGSFVLISPKNNSVGLYHNEKFLMFYHHNNGQITATPLKQVILDDLYEDALLITFQTEF